MPKTNYDRAMEMMIKGLQDWGKVQGERNKLMGDILANEMKMRRNFIYNMMEARQKNEMISPYQRWMQQEYQKQPQFGEGMNAEQFITRPRVVPGTSGFKMEMPSREAQLYGYLKMKQRAGKLDKEDEDMFRRLYKKLFGVEFGTPLEPSPDFQVRRGLPALLSKRAANLNTKTLHIIDQIETLEDLQELLEREDEASQKGIDIDAILEYYGKTREQVLMGR